MKVKIGYTGIIATTEELLKEVAFQQQYADEYLPTPQEPHIHDEKNENGLYEVWQDNYDHNDDEKLGEYKTRQEAIDKAEEVQKEIIREITEALPEIEIPCEPYEISIGTVERGRYPQSRSVEITINGEEDWVHWDANGTSDTWANLKLIAEHIEEAVNRPPMTKEELIEHLVESATLDEPTSDKDTGATWRNGNVTLPSGTEILMGGGWIHNEETAHQKNEEQGIARGLAQGVFYPNETCVGDFEPYGSAEDESGWEEYVMPLLLGDDWKEHEDADEIIDEIFTAVQKEMKRLHEEEQKATAK